jgi:hypothetical protein
VVALNIEFVLVNQVVFAQEAYSGGSIPIILVLGGFLRNTAGRRRMWGTAHAAAVLQCLQTKTSASGQLRAPVGSVMPGALAWLVSCRKTQKHCPTCGFGSSSSVPLKPTFFLYSDAIFKNLRR